MKFDEAGDKAACSGLPAKGVGQTDPIGGVTVPRALAAQSAELVAHAQPVTAAQRRSKSLRLG